MTSLSGKLSKQQMTMTVMRGAKGEGGKGLDEGEGRSGSASGRCSVEAQEKEEGAREGAERRRGVGAGERVEKGGTIMA